MRKSLTIILLALTCSVKIKAQPFSIKQLSTANGLSDNKVNCVVTDKNGFLWVGTDNGLNVYDGYDVRSYFKEHFNALCSNTIEVLFCDSRNRIWIGSATGTTLLDKDRHFSLVSLNDSIKTNYYCNEIFETKSGIVQYTNNGNFIFDEKKNSWLPLKWTNEQSKIGWRDHSYFKDNSFIETGRERIIIFDYTQQKKIFDLRQPFCISACRLNDDEIMVALYKGRLLRVSTSKKKIIKEYPLTTLFNKKEVNTEIASVRQAANGDIIVGTSLGGMYVFHPATETFTQISRNPMYNSSLTVNEINKIYCDTTGNVFLIEPNRRLVYFNIFKYQAVNISGFTGIDQLGYDGYINCMSRDAKGRLWLGGQDCLVMQDEQNKVSKVYRFYYPVEKAGERPIPIQAIVFDKSGKLWVATHNGIAQLNEKTGQFTSYSRDTVFGRLPNFSNNFVDDILLMPDGKIWCCTFTGITSFDPVTGKFETMNNHPVLKDMPRRRLYRIITDNNGNTWMGSAANGVFVYDRENNCLDKFSKDEGLADNFINSLACDNANNIYVATSKGLSVIDPSGKIKTYTSGDGLRYNDCQSLLKDSAGNIWIGNHSVLIKFVPSTGAFEYYDEKDGLPGENFRINAGMSGHDDLLYWGTEKGYVFFTASKLRPDSSSLQVITYQADAADTVFRFTTSAKLTFKHYQNTISFSFTTVDLYSEKDIFYQYILEGQDKNWINSTGNRQVRYNSLSPGKYFFKVRVSRNGESWIEAANTITVVIRPAFWQTWWFKVLIILLLAGAAWCWYRQRIRKIKKDERFKSNYEKKIAEVEMQALRAQMNPHFMFNSLNSINNFILKNDPDNASGYLTKFSRLMRLILDNSRSEWVLLENEMKALELYIQLEAVRFDNAFSYSIKATKDIDTETTMIPPLIIQPYVENAIWHGLLHRKEPGGRLDINLWRQNDTLYIEIEDNGVGREEAKRLKSKTAIKQKSHGMKITAERMDIVNKVYNVNAGVTITDPEKGTGTRVLITFKFKTHDSHYSG